MSYFLGLEVTGDFVSVVWVEAPVLFGNVNPERAVWCWYLVLIIIIVV